MNAVQGGVTAGKGGVIAFTRGAAGVTGPMTGVKGCVTAVKGRMTAVKGWMTAFKRRMTAGKGRATTVLRPMIAPNSSPPAPLLASKEGGQGGGVNAPRCGATFHPRPPPTTSTQRPRCR